MIDVIHMMYHMSWWNQLLFLSLAVMVFCLAAGCLGMGDDF